jgi:SAM-dependent methyltransferase
MRSTNPAPAGHRTPPIGDPFSLWGKNWLVWRIHRQHVRSVAYLARGRAVDIGCGEQPIRNVFDGRVTSIIGLDHPRTIHPDDRVEVFGTALDLPFREEAFDTALCFQVLEHVPEPLQLLSEARRVLRPGGHLILTAPHIWNVHEAPHDYFRYTEYGLAHLLRRAGLEVVEVRAMAGYFVTAGARLCYFLGHFDRWGLQVLVRPLYFLIQGSSWILDRLYCDRSETWNYLAVARRPAEGGRA